MQRDRLATGHLGAPQSREQALMSTGTQTQVRSHRVERTFLKPCSKTLPTPTRPTSHCPASAGAFQCAVSSQRPQRGYRGSLSESYWKSGRSQAEAVGDEVHTGRRDGQAWNAGFPATPLPGGPAACLRRVSHRKHRRRRAKSRPSPRWRQLREQSRRVGGCRFPHTASWPGD